MVKKIGILISIFTAFILLNLFTRFLYSQSWFGTTTFSKELNPFDIISLIVSSIVTIWLGWYVSKKLTEQRYQKEYIINDLKQIEEEISFIEKNIMFSSTDLQTQLDILNRLNNYIDKFSKTIQIFQIKYLDITELLNNYTILYKKTTNLESTQLSMDDAIRYEINKVCNDFIVETRKLIFKINTH